jgi:hypothetical protein
MAEMGMGYGSECHLLRYLGRHRTLLDQKISEVVGADTISWLDHPFDPTKGWLDGELKGLDFLPPTDPALNEWKQVWPQRGNPPNWDAVAQVGRNGIAEWLLVEAKANVQELQSSCQADPQGGRLLITRTLAATKTALGVPADRDWLNGHYQFCNRVAVLNFLNRHGSPARLLFIYFLGDKGDARRICPADAAEWRAALDIQKKHVGLPERHPLADRIHQLFLHVSPSNLEGAAVV